DVLTLDRIQQRFGVSRTVARETMRVLESMGLVRSRRRVGITVQPRSNWNVFDPRVIWWRLAGSGRNEQLRSLTELRIAVEPLAAAAAARSASAAERAEIVELAADMRTLGEAGKLAALMGYDDDFLNMLQSPIHHDIF